ncbi:MAG TPA: hypothetical protein VK819_06675 [Acidobacteriaceae bacterium]|jgi:hypothetical protein|nr:hypothetical protein [Acidobacteriaceae bacterium]
MQSRSPFPPAQQFILDCAELASTLDSLDPGGHRFYVVATLLSSRAQYHALLLRREELSPSVVEERWMEFMLDALLARLTILEGRIQIGTQLVRKARGPCHCEPNSQVSNS